MRADLLTALKVAKASRVTAQMCRNVIDEIDATHPALVDEAVRNELRVHKSAGQEAINTALDARVDKVTEFDCLVQRIEELEDTLRNVARTASMQPRDVRRLDQIQALIERVMP